MPLTFKIMFVEHSQNSWYLLEILYTVLNYGKSKVIFFIAFKTDIFENSDQNAQVGLKSN